MRWVVTMALVLLATLPTAAAPASGVPAGQDVETVFREFGLLGTWAVDCTRPAELDNPRVSDVLLSPGEVMERHDLGPGSEPNLYSILAAKRLSKTRIGLWVIFRPGQEGEQRQRLEMVVRDDTRRTLFNQPQGGPVRVKDGVVVGYGLKTPLLHKCE